MSIKTNVVHCRDPHDVYIGRTNPRAGFPGSIWANPFHPGRDGTRDNVLDLHLEMVLLRDDLLFKLRHLRGKRLGCWCKPKKRCHGDTLAWLADMEQSAVDALVEDFRATHKLPEIPEDASK